MIVFLSGNWMDTDTQNHLRQSRETIYGSGKFTSTCENYIRRRKLFFMLVYSKYLFSSLGAFCVYGFYFEDLFCVTFGNVFFSLHETSVTTRNKFVNVEITPTPFFLTDTRVSVSEGVLHFVLLMYYSLDALMCNISQKFKLKNCEKWLRIFFKTIINSVLRFPYGVLKCTRFLIILYKWFWHEVCCWFLLLRILLCDLIRKHLDTVYE